MSTTLPKRLQGALLRIRSDHPFFGTLALFAELQVTTAVATAATDGQTIWFNPDFVERQDSARLCGLVAHELLHAALQHGSRCGMRDPLLWNIAADVVVNGMVRLDTQYDLPEGGVEMPALAHLSVEEVYEQLRSGRHQIARLGLVDLLPHGLPGEGGECTMSQDGAMERERQDALHRHWRAALQQAGAVARRYGKGFGRDGLGAHRDSLRASEPTLGWRELLWQHLVATPYDFGGFDRRFVYRGLYVEDMVGDAVEVAICVDTSGSIGSEELADFMGEIQGILDAYPNIRETLFFADAELYGPHEFGRDAAVPEARGGGGTDFRPFFKWMGTHRAHSPETLCIYLTDGFGSFPKQAPEHPVLWVVSPGGLESRGFPFGQVARMGA